MKRPKLYMHDAGLAAFLAGVHSPEQLRSSPMAGALWETLVCAELRRWQLNHYGDWQLHFWRDRAREADFLFHQGGTFNLADAKWAEQSRQREATALRKVAARLPANATQAMTIFCRAPNAFPLHESVTASPLDGVPDWYRE